MAKVTVNGGVERFTRLPATLGELLDDLDRRCETRGEVLAAVSCNGVEQPGFRDNEVRERKLSDLELVEVEALKPCELLLSVLDEAAVAVDALERATGRLDAGFRGTNPTSAKQELSEFAQSLGTLATLTNAVAAIVVGPAASGQKPAPPVALICELSLQTEALINAQRAEDWITVADIIELEIGGTLRRWPEVLVSLRRLVSDFFLSV